MRMGFAMRQQAIAAVFAKALRLNSSSIADISAGKVTCPACPAMDIQTPLICCIAPCNTACSTFLCVTPQVASTALPA